MLSLSYLWFTIEDWMAFFLLSIGLISDAAHFGMLKFPAFAVTWRRKANSLHLSLFFSFMCHLLHRALTDGWQREKEPALAFIGGSHSLVSSFLIWSSCHHLTSLTNPLNWWGIKRRKKIKKEGKEMVKTQKGKGIMWIITKRWIRKR